ncbi:MAG: SPOR domain-containing protein [Cytophagales bacterium]|nr:MAG: SPOR domain-containing protein [Cytophagales bacterium]
MKYIFYGAGLLFFLASCTPKGLPKTSQDLKEDLSVYRPSYSYQKEVYEGAPVVVRVAMPIDTTAQKYDVTDRLTSYLDREIPKYIARVERKTIMGYRIQIYRGKSREEAERAKRICYQLFPKINIYTQYSSPNYRVKVGDFIETTEYIPIYNRLKREFPATLVVPDMITITIMNDE